MSSIHLGKKTELGKLEKNCKARIVHVGGDSDMNSRFLSMGLLEGSVIEVLHEAPFGRDPIAVHVRGALIGLRRNEANFIQVEVLS